MKNQDQANKNNNLNEPAVAKDPQTLVEDLPMSGEQEERVKGGRVVIHDIAITKTLDKTTP